MSNAPRQGAGGSASSKILAGAACFVGVTAYYTRDLTHENTIGDDSVRLRPSKRF
jgi:hypothetical protein